MSIVKSLSVGNGDMFYIRHATDSFTIIDCSMDIKSRGRIVRELKDGSDGKGVTRFISTHPDEDHILGLRHLDEQFGIRNFYCVDNAAEKPEPSEDFRHYCALRSDPGRAFFLHRNCERKWLNQSGDGRNGAGIQVLWPDTSNARYKAALDAARRTGEANNISPIIRYSLQGGASIVWMGDLGSEFMAALAGDGVVQLHEADIVFAPHHGRDSGKIPPDWLAALAPRIIVIGEAPSEHLNYYSGYHTITQNSAGDIIFDLRAGKTHVFVSDSSYEAEFLLYEGPVSGPGTYIGTLPARPVKAAAKGA